MLRRRQRVRPLDAALVLAAAIALHALGALSRVEHGLTEIRSRMLAREVESDIVIIGIDEHSLTELGEWVWPRRHYARLLQHLERAQPRRVFIDVDFSSRSDDPLDDELLESALAAWSGAPVLLPLHFTPEADGRAAPGTVVRALPRFAAHSGSAAVVLEPDGDGLVREARSSWRVDGELVPSVFDEALRLPPVTVMKIDYSILPSSFRKVSFSDFLNGEIGLEGLRGKTVYVGGSAAALRDFLPVPVHRTLPGVTVLALATETLRAGPPRSLPTWGYLALLAAWTAASVLLLDRHAWRRNASVLAGGLVLLGAAALYLYAAHRVDLEVVPFAFVLLAMFVVAALRSVDAQTLRAIAYALRLRRRDALLRSIVESTSDSIVCVDASGAIRTANAATARLFGCRGDELIGTALERFVPGISRALDEADGAPGATEHAALAADGRRLPVEVSVSRVAVDDARLFTVIVRDVTERKAQQRRLEHQATHDSLTGLPNRNALYRRLDAALRGDAGGARSAMLLLDLTRFSEVNDTLGHDVGDELLAEAARRLAAAVDEHAFVARIGADEFAVLLSPIASREAVDECAAALLAGLREPFNVQGISIDVGATIGIALYPEHAHDAKELLRRADVAMYGAKRRGNPIEYYDQEHDRHTVRRLGMISELRAALSSDGLALHYQPQVNLKSGRVEAVEALIRWRHPMFGDVRPDEFIGLAESSHLIRPLTQWTLHQALTDVSAWSRRGVKLRVAVNLSARMLQDLGLAESLERLLGAYSVELSQLELEITESAMMHDPERARRVVKDLRALGIGVSVDDYGTGFSSLGYLRDLKVGTLKLDKSFVLDLETRAENRVIVESTAHLAHALDLEIVAEGIETKWVKDYLTSVGYDLGQGYWFSRPLPADECCAWIAAYNSGERRRAG